eukprot:gene9179-34516_t
MYLYNSNCWAQCPAGTFGTTTNDAACTLICKPVNKKCKSDGEYSVAEPTASSDRVCHECHGDCASCTGPDPWQCLECPNNREKHSDGAADRPGICYSKRCGEGMYATEAGACVACDNSCATCSGKQKDQCISCTDNTFLHANVTGKFCVATCPDYYGVLGPEGGSSRSCKQCDTRKCTACAGLASHCTSCRGRLGQKYLLNGRCIETCPDGFYAAGSITDGFVCERCLDPCRTCRPNQNDFCLSCLEGFFLHEEGTLLEGKCVGSCALGHQAILATPTPATTTTTPTAITTSAAPPTDACACKNTWEWDSVTYNLCSLPPTAPTWGTCHVDDLKVGWLGTDSNFLSFDTAKAVFGKQSFVPGNDLPIQLASQRDGCSSLSNAMPEGGIILIERGECSFDIKAEHGQATGADYVIIFNTDDRDDVGTMSCSECRDILVPVNFLTYESGSALEAMIADPPSSGAFASIFCNDTHISTTSSCVCN